MNKINKIFQLFAAQSVAPTTELIYKTDFELLVAVILSAQSTDIAVNLATKELFKVANTPQAMLQLGEADLIEYIKRIGLYRTKAKNLLTMASQLLAEYNAKVPSSYEQLINLAGVGRKTANVILNTLFKQDTIAVDTHVFRVSRRLGIATGATVYKVEVELNTVVPQRYKYNAHHWLILHGRYVCRARVPQCRACIVKQYCQYFKQAVDDSACPK